MQSQGADTLDTPDTPDTPSDHEPTQVPRGVHKGRLFSWVDRPTGDPAYSEDSTNLKTTFHMTTTNMTAKPQVRAGRRCRY